MSLHAGKGENGCIQGLLQFMEIKHTHSSIMPSSLFMDKHLSKIVFNSLGILTPYSFVINDIDSDINDRIDFPYVIKPINQGSSIDINIFHDKNDYLSKKSLYKNYKYELMVEKYISGRELTVGIILGDIIDIVEVNTKNEFFNYDAKYNGSTRYIVSPDIPQYISNYLTSKSMELYDLFQCKSTIRADFIYDEIQDKVFLLEVNTIPGFTELSFIPMIAKKHNISFQELLEMILQDALI